MNKALQILVCSYFTILAFDIELAICNSDEIGNRKTYSLITINKVIPTKNKVIINGLTDLPDGSRLMVSFHVWKESTADLYVGVNNYVLSNKGAFSSTLHVPINEDFQYGPFEILVLFTPYNQADSILDLVGKNGEFLSGELTKKSSDFQTLKVVKKTSPDFKFEFPKFTFQLPSEFPKGSATRALAEYILSWKNEDWDRMVVFSQKTWRKSHPDAANIMKAWCEDRPLYHFEITQFECGDVACKVEYILKYESPVISNKIITENMGAFLVKEISPYTPDLSGDWGVNPVTCWVGEVIDE